MDIVPERRDVDVDVVIVGAGPTGLMLAGELCLSGVRPLVLERRSQLRETPKAYGFNGQIVELLRYCIRIAGLSRTVSDFILR